MKNLNLLTSAYIYNSSVHIKLHVPEIIKRHTHVRTIFKHHPKPKHYKVKKPPRHHHEPKMKHLQFEVAESRPIWIPKPPQHKPKPSKDTVPINEWQHALSMRPIKKPKHSKNNPYELIEMMAEAEDDDGYKAKLYKQFQLEEKLKGRHMIPDYMMMDSSLNFGRDTDEQDDVYPATSLDHFNQPQLLKITDADIRPHATTHTPKWGQDYESGGHEVAYYKKPHEWPKVAPSSLAYQYTTLAPFHLTDEESFVPSTLIQQTKHSSLEDYPNLFQSNRPKTTDLQYTYTKYKNRQSLKNAMSSLNTRIN